MILRIAIREERASITGQGILSTALKEYQKQISNESTKEVALP